jgi:branched-subunit amino acid aminotransferase/4-amino-4-deoxychorismate lyase
MNYNNYSFLSVIPMANEHAPLALRDKQLIPWEDNRINMASVPVQYGYGCLDGIINTLKVDGGRVFLSTVDAGAHFARHIFNSVRSVLYKKAEEAGTLEQALSAGRAYDFGYPLSLETREGPMDLREYYSLYLSLVFDNMKQGFVHGNYVRPFYSPCDERKDGEESDFQINGRIYKKTFSIMMQHWPNILSPRHPDFPGLNVLLCRDSLSPYPGTSLIEYKHESSYAPTRGPAVEEKERFNALFGDKLKIHDILLMDYSGNHIREASGSNIFFIAPSGFVHTPGLDGSIFPGLTRDFVLRLLKSKIGTELGFVVDDRHEYTQRVDLETARWFSMHGEMFLTGSALGIIPVKRLVVPKKENPQVLEDYEIMEFRTGQDTKTALIQDCYKCFSVGDAFEVSDGAKRVQVSEFASWPLLIEVPEHLRQRAIEKLVPQGMDLPLDQTMRSGKVRPVPSKTERRIASQTPRLAANS